MGVYPDLSLMQKLDDAVYQNNKKMDIKWMPRKVFPNKIENDSSNDNFNTYEDPDKMEAKNEWVFYKKALNKIKDYCNKKGVIVNSNKLTNSNYLEVYSWEEMISNSPANAELDEAKRIQKEGYLDCYVLVTCFHYDIYDQYTDFVSKNKSKLADYYKKFIVSR